MFLRKLTVLSPRTCLSQFSENPIINSSGSYLRGTGGGYSITRHLCTRTRTQHMSQARNWCFTYNNPTESPDDFLTVFIKDKRTRFVVFQKEQGEEGTIHYQGYCEFSTPVKLGGLKKIHKSVHWEPRRGTRDEARNYCIKEDTRIEGPWEYGEWGQTRGQRSDLAELYRLAKESKQLQEVAEAVPGCYIRHYRAVQHVRELFQVDKPTRTTDLQVILVLGKTGLGKTRYAYDNWPQLWEQPFGTKQGWFNGYQQQPTVLINEYKGQYPLAEFLRLIDRYPIQVPTKGGFTWWCPDIIVLTSNYHPRTWYDYGSREEHYRALCRRITKIHHLKADEEPEILEGEALDNFLH